MVAMFREEKYQNNPEMCFKMVSLTAEHWNEGFYRQKRSSTMTMRRPKKMARPTGVSSSASRLGPGMETVELRFLPEGGWLEGDAGHGKGVKAPVTPWVISWEVGAGASVDRGLRLARLKCTGTGAGKGVGATAEQSIIGEKLYPRI